MTQKTEILQAVRSTLDLSAARSLRQDPTPEAAPSLEGWTPADLEWRAALPPIMHDIAARHGRMLYQYIRGAGMFNEALGHMVRRLRGNKEMEQCLVVVQSQMQVYAMHLHDTLTKVGKTPADMVQAKLDIERAMTLANSVTSEISS